MKAKIIVVFLIGIALVTLSPSLLTSKQASAQMMNPSMMKNPNMMNMMRNFTMANGWTPDMMRNMMMNPNFMMPNSSLIGSMMVAGPNITGSINLKPAIFNSIASQIKVNLSDAVASAQKQVGEKSRIISAHLDVANGYLTYTICAIDPDMNMQRLIIDAGNGKILLTQRLPAFNMMNPMMMGGMGMMNPMMIHMWR